MAAFEDPHREDDSLLSAPCSDKVASVLRLMFLFSGIAHNPESWAIGMQNIRGSSKVRIQPASCKSTHPLSGREWPKSLDERFRVEPESVVHDATIGCDHHEPGRSTGAV